MATTTALRSKVGSVEEVLEALEQGEINLGKVRAVHVVDS
jgi:hypothetical protein